jgi:hypothetical protein
MTRSHLLYRLLMTANTRDQPGCFLRAHPASAHRQNTNGSTLVMEVPSCKSEGRPHTHNVTAALMRVKVFYRANMENTGVVASDELGAQRTHRSAGESTRKKPTTIRVRGVIDLSGIEDDAMIQRSQRENAAAGRTFRLPTTPVLMRPSMISEGMYP